MRIVLLWILVAAVYWSNGENKTSTAHRVTHTAWLNISIANKTIGRIEIGVFGKVVPLTAKNFVNLAMRPTGQGYKGSKFHVTNKRMLIGGDCVSGNGKGGTSSYDNPKFRTENYKIKHYGAGWVTSPSHGTDGHNSIFIITLFRLPKLDGISVVFGKVIKGMNVARRIARVPMKNRKPIEDVIISDCGAEMAEPPFFVDENDATD